MLGFIHLSRGTQKIKRDRKNLKFAETEFHTKGNLDLYLATFLV